MNRILRTSGLIMLALLFQQCYSQSNKSKTAIMENTQSHPDSLVNKTDEEWKKYFRLTSTMLQGKKEPRGLLQVNLKLPRKLERTIVRFVEIPCSEVIPNSKAVAAGRVFMNQSVKPASFI